MTWRRCYSEGVRVNCDCMSKLKAKLKEEYGESAELTNTGFGFNQKLNMIDEVPEPIRFRYHPRRKDGSESKAWKKAVIMFNYCPMCGKPVKPG